MCVYNPLVTIVKHSGFCGWKVLSEYKVIILTWQFCLPTLDRITTDFSSGSDGFSMFQINISNHLKKNLGDWKFSSVKRVYCFLMWFGNYKVCVSPAFLRCSDSLNFRYTKVLTCSPFTALLQWLFLKQYNWIVLLFCICFGSICSQLAKWPLQSAVPGFLKGLLGRVWFLHVNQHVCCSVAFWAVSECQWIQQCVSPIS